jgi:mono/diheme cytochrome c family protein
MMRLAPFLFFALAFALPAQAEEDAAVLAGEKLFATHCSSCHGVAGRGAAGPNLRDEATVHGNGYYDIFDVILNGVKNKPMEAWRDRLSVAEIEQICAYIVYLQANNEGAPQASNDLGRYRM